MNYQNTQTLPRKGHPSKLCEPGNFQEDHTTITLQDLQHSLVDNRGNTHQQAIALVLQNTVLYGEGGSKEPFLKKNQVKPSYKFAKMHKIDPAAI